MKFRKGIRSAPDTLILHLADFLVCTNGSSHHRRLHHSDVTPVLNRGFPPQIAEPSCYDCGSLFLHIKRSIFCGLSRGTDAFCPCPLTASDLVDINAACVLLCDDVHETIAKDCEILYPQPLTAS